MPAGAPTYWTETTAEGQKVYHCLYCQEQASEHHSSDEILFLQHMEQRHDGRMVEDVDASAAARSKPEDTPGGRPDTPPGQEGEQPGNRPDVPPGQAEEDVPEPTHPIAYPEEPYVEHHEEPKP